MKKFLLLILLFSTAAFAQDTIKVSESDRSFSLGNKNAFIVEIPQANVKTVNSNWKTYLKQQSRRASSEKSGEIVLPKGPINNVSSDSITVFSQVTSEGAKIKLVAFFMMSDSTFLSSEKNSEMSMAANHFIRQFGVKEYKNAVNEEMILEQKKQKELEKKVDELEEQSEGWRKDIKDNDRFISRKKDEITANEQEQSLKSTAIINQKTLLMNFVGDQEQRSKEEKLLKQYEKEKEKLQDNKESMMKKIDDAESDSRSLQKRIDKNNEELIPDAKTNVARQKVIVMNVIEKMNKIQ